jgi:ATPase subunit of ABC transporter with duplicated ATPase domains
MRIALAKLLLEKPDLLLLDEPTNHLDLETRNWLENYLSTWENGYILISHDRYFLDVTVNKIIEIWNKGLHVYHGNYEKYLTQKAERRAQLEAAYKNQRERIEHLEVFISRFRYQATKAKQVQSRIKEARARKRELHHRPRRPHCAGRRERRGEIDADPAAERAGVAHGGHAEAGTQRGGGIFCAGSVQGAGPRRADAG